jgi:hypothetical protein
VLDEGRVATDDELIASPRQPHVEPLTRPVSRLVLVEREDDGRTLQALEAEDVP